jgi:hypothetical protein
MEIRTEAYSVQELIDKLQQIEDKSIKVYYDDNEWGVQPVRYIRSNDTPWGSRNAPNDALILDCADM